jgi:cell division septation protein DedD
MKNNQYIKFLQRLVAGCMALSMSACATDLQTRVAGNLTALSKNQTVAILPVEISDPGQKEMAKMFRQGLYANLKQSKFHLLERYVIDGLLKQNKLTDPSTLLAINPMQFGEILGVDAIVFSRINKVERSYFILHSSIELSVSVQMVDTRSGEILWRAEQTEQDFSGIGKIPTGITTALLAPIQFVTNKFNLSRMTSNMVDKLTVLIKHPNEADKENQFKKPVIAKNATNELKKIEELQQLKAEWQEALILDEEAELSDSSENLESNKESLVELTTKPDSNLVKKNIMQARSLVQERKRVESEMPPLSPKKEAKISVPINLSQATTVEPIAVIESKEARPITRSHVGTSAKQLTSLKTQLYTIQVGAYKTIAHARKLEQSLKRKGYDVFITRNGKNIYRVQVDRFKSKEDAIKLAHRIQIKEKLKNFVTRFSGV